MSPNGRRWLASLRLRLGETGDWAKQEPARRSDRATADQKKPSSSIIRWIRDAGIRGDPGGTSKVGNRRELFFGAGFPGASPRRARVERTLPNRSPETRERCTAAWYTSSSSVTVVRIRSV